jgi:hypothetical protein
MSIGARARSRILGVVVATGLISPALGLGLTSPAQAAESIALSPTSGPVGTAVTIQGSGWDAGTGLTVQWNCGWSSTDRRAIAKVTTDSGGRWSAGGAVPNNCTTQGSEVWVEALGGPHGSPAGVFNLTSVPPATNHPPQIIPPVETFTDGVMVWVRVHYQDPDGNTAGFGFHGAKGSGWAEETHPFSSPSYGRTITEGVEYPFNHECGRPGQYESDIEFWVYDATGLRSALVPVHLACSTQKQTPTVQTLQPNVWAGWGGGKAQGGVTSVTGSWVVPQVTCSLLNDDGGARAAMWVGLTGGGNGGSVVGDDNNWLAQIGTESKCASSIPLYRVVYQLYRTNPGGIKPQLGPAILGTYINSSPVVTASVSYDDKTGKFTAKIDVPGLAPLPSLTATSTSKTRPGDDNVTTMQDVSVDTAHKIGVCVLERDAPPPPTPSAGLANFGTASFRDCKVDGQPVGSLGQVLQFPMDGNRIKSMTKPDPTSGGFTLTWQQK